MGLPTSAIRACPVSFAAHTLCTLLWNARPYLRPLFAMPDLSLCTQHP